MNNIFDEGEAQLLEEALEEALREDEAQDAREQAEAEAAWEDAQKEDPLHEAEVWHDKAEEDLMKAYHEHIENQHGKLGKIQYDGQGIMEQQANVVYAEPFQHYWKDAEEYYFKPVLKKKVIKLSKYLSD